MCVDRLRSWPRSGLERFVVTGPTFGADRDDARMAHRLADRRGPARPAPRVPIPREPPHDRPRPRHPRGTVVDGTGAPARTPTSRSATASSPRSAGRRTRAAATIDADGLLVTPGLRRHPHALRRQAFPRAFLPTSASPCGSPHFSRVMGWPRSGLRSNLPETTELADGGEALDVLNRLRDPLPALRFRSMIMAPVLSTLDYLKTNFQLRGNQSRSKLRQRALR